MRERLAARRGDASDADTTVLEQQLARDPGDIGWARARL
jgi:predicted kinase